MSFVTRVDNLTGTEITIHYEVVGQGKPSIVFHHGNGNCIKDWYALGYVSALKSDFQLVLIDRQSTCFHKHQRQTFLYSLMGLPQKDHPFD